MEKIYFDAEMADINKMEIKFLSLCLIKENGSFLYLKLKHENLLITKWVKENVLPEIEKCDRCMNGWVSGGNGCHLMRCPECGGSGKATNFVSEKEAKKRILEFLGDEKFQMVADVNQFDWIGWCQLMGGVWEQPLNYIPLDLATLIASKGIDPDIDRDELAQRLDIQIYGVKHNAKADALLTRKIWNALFYLKPGSII